MTAEVGKLSLNKLSTKHKTLNQQMHSYYEYYYLF
jgi:hypothetical protein